MKKINKMILSSLLAIVMTISLIPCGFTLNVSAASTGEKLAETARLLEGKTASYFGFTDSWCARFVIYCAKQSGITNDIIHLKSASSTTMYDKTVNEKGAIVVKSPKAGDLVFYRCNECYNDKKNPKLRLTHVGIMISDKKSAEGNIQKKVTFISQPPPQAHGMYCSTHGSLKYSKNAATGYTPVYIRPNYSNSISYTVAFNLNGITGITVPAKQIITSGDKVTKPSNPSCAGYKFDGWYKEKECNNKWDFDTTIKADMTLYAKWTKVSTYTVTFNLNDGTSATYSKQTVFFGNKATEPTIPKRDNYNFGGWYKEKECVNKCDFNTVVTTNVVLYAKWMFIPATDTLRENQTESPELTIVPETNTSQAKQEGWTNWSSSINAPSGTTDTETRYRIRHKETTTANTSSLSGWEYVGMSDTIVGEWSAWTTTPIQANSSTEVQTQTKQETTYTTKFNYYRYTYTYNSERWMTYSKNPGRGTGLTYETKQTDLPLPYYESFGGYAAYGTKTDNWFRVDISSPSAPGGSFETKVPNGSSSITEYRSRYISGNWYFYRWGDWSDWKSGATPNSSSNMQVEVEYRFYLG